MKFDSFKKSISKIKNLDLPGREAQLKMAPAIRREELEAVASKISSSKRAAVMCLFYPNEEEETFFVLILRKTYKGVHSNQVGFPGGKVEESDRNLEHTALRETEEEIGIAANSIRVHKKCSTIYIPPSNFTVQPFIGTLDETPVFTPQESEVEAVLEVALSDFLSDEKVITKTLETSYAQQIKVPAFLLNDQVVWGATAMMLSEIKQLLKEIL